MWMAAGASSLSVRSTEIEHVKHHGRWLGRAQATVHKTTQSFFLRDLGYERNSFCKLTMVKTDDRKLVTGRRLGWSSTAVGMAFGGAPAPRTPPAVTV
jgi:hypothetical protein